MNILEVDDVKKYFGEVRALDGVSLGFEERELTSIIGPNGAGKSTFFNVVTGKIRPGEGKVLFKGVEITNLKPYEIAKMGVSRAFQISNVFPELTVYENLRIGVLSRLEKTMNFLSLDSSMEDVNEETGALLKAVRLEDNGELPCGTLSHGDHRLVEIGIALATEPQMLLLDEPTAGMSQKETREMVKFIKELHTSRDITILLTEHDMDVVFSISERIIVMHQGKVIADDQPDKIKGIEAVKEAYLGE